MSDSSHPESKAELLERMRSGRGEWDALFAQVPEVVVTQPVLEGGWSVKDLMAHVATYEGWTAAQIRAANEGRQPTSMELYGFEDIPEDPEGWDPDRQSAAIRARYKDMPLDDVMSFAGQTFARLLAAVEAVSEDEIARKGAQAWAGNDSLLEILPGNCYGHYEQHRDDLRAIAGQDTCQPTHSGNQAATSSRRAKWSAGGPVGSAN